MSDIVERLRKFLTMEDHPGDVAFLEAIEEAADEIERKDTEIAKRAPRPWHPVNPPEGIWLRTRRAAEDGENVCMWRDLGSGEREWIERDGGRTTVTHHSFAAPTEWAYLPAPAAEQKP